MACCGSWGCKYSVTPEQIQSHLKWLLQSVFPINKNHKFGAVDFSIQAVMWTKLYDIQAKFFGDSQLNFYYSSRMSLGQKYICINTLYMTKVALFSLLDKFFLYISQFSRSVMSDSLWPHGLQHARLPYHLLPEPTQTHVRQVSDSIQPSHTRLSPSPATFNLSQHQSLYQ